MEANNITRLHNSIETIINKDLIKLTISHPLDKKNPISKMQIKPVLIKDKLLYQVEEYKGNQAFHNNLPKEQCINSIVQILSTGMMGQLNAISSKKETIILTNKKGTLTIKEKKINSNTAEPSAERFSHDKNKKYILSEGEKIDFLIALGVMTPEGKIAKSRYDKFKQINRYLEFVRDVLPALDQSKQLNIIDFGCGKSYLTFALYYYLNKKLGLSVRITGLDLKAQVIKDCQALANKLGYEDLNFLCGDIKDYQDIASSIDMVITLHACDTATDYAIEKAVRWNSKVIMAVPCCHKEVNRQLKSNNLAITDKALSSIMKYGLIKERMASLITDAYRGIVLEENGYTVDIMEFIDMEHTPKNILIRAVKSNKIKADVINHSDNIENSYQISPSLGKLLQ